MSKIKFLGFAPIVRPDREGGTDGSRQPADPGRGGIPVAEPADSGGNRPVLPVRNGILTIPARMEEIPEELCMGREDIFAVEFEEPCSVRKIGRAAFCDCVKLREIRFPPDIPLQTVGEDAFRRCTALETLHLPEGTEELDTDAFSECVSLNDLQLPRTLKSIGRGAFALCFRLRHVAIPESVSSIGDEAFYLSRSAREYISLDFGKRTDFSGIDPNVMRQSHLCPYCGRPRPRWAVWPCPCGR